MKLSILAFAFCLTLMACKKDSDSNNPTTTELLTKGDWKYDNGGIGDASGNIIVDFTTISYIPDCALDNSVRFNANGSGTVYENADVCQGEDATSTFNWSLSSDEKRLTLSDKAVNGIGGAFKIKALTDTKMTLTKDTTFPGAGSATAIVNLTH